MSTKILAFCDRGQLCSYARLIEPNENNQQYTVLGDPRKPVWGSGRAKVALTEMCERSTATNRELTF
jgi:hypothetical protein